MNCFIYELILVDCDFCGVLNKRLTGVTLRSPAWILFFFQNSVLFLIGKITL